MQKYNPKKIEKKWQDKWEKDKLYEAKDSAGEKENYMLLTEFPYPSGNLHIGHWLAFSVPDILARFLRMQGENVMYPMGFDAFGLPAENAAIKRGLNPRKWTEQNIKFMTRQFATMGGSFDWSRKVSTIAPEYYKWTQWIFLKMLKKGLVKKTETTVNWCPKDKTVLANEQVVDNCCERCDSPVVQKKMKQWVLKITDYADRLIDDIEGLDWPESTKLAQKNWIGRSEGAEIIFKIKNSNYDFTVFTTRLDTIYGCTYCVVAPENELVQNLKDQISNWKDVEKYIKQAKRKTDLERMELQKEKTGVELKGLKAINPFTNEAVPIYVADYVLSTYGTGAVMAVPAHDERDFEFAKKYKLPIRQSVTPNYEGYKETKKTLDVLNKINSAAKKENLKIWLLGGLGCAFHAGIIYRSHEDLDLIAKDGNQLKKAIKIFEKLGFKKIKEKKLSETLTNHVFANRDGIEIDIGPNVGEWGLTDKDFEKDTKALNGYETYVLSRKFHIGLKKMLLKERKKEKDGIDLGYLKGRVLVEDGFLVNSEKYSGLTSEKAREEMVKWLEKNRLGRKKKNFRLHDWVISRQRYWGVPIPVVYCEKCGIVPVPEKDLPVRLPELKDFLPTGDGKSPLAKAEKWVNARCPKCQGPAKRETDTMDTFVDSSWYFIRYADPKNKKKFADASKMKKWLPVPLYIGGAEHNTMHLLYSRFFTKVLYDLKLVHFNEPFTGRRNHGIILGPDKQKMSKSRGNVIDPDAEVKKWGADSVRMYLAFMGPYDQNATWQMTGIVGLRRFLERVWNLNVKIKISNFKSNPKSKFQISKLDSLLHKTIKKVTEDIENLRFNTAISAMMILLNEFEKQEKISTTHYSLFTILLAPFAPHIAEELWSGLGHKKSIFLEKWPKYDQRLVAEKETNIVVQVNGKVRDQLTVSAEEKEEDIKKLAFESEKIKKYIPNVDNIRKIIFVPGRLINFVI